MRNQGELLRLLMEVKQRRWLRLPNRLNIDSVSEFHRDPLDVVANIRFAVSQTLILRSAPLSLIGGLRA